MIMEKPITSAPPRLQRMLVTLQSYNMTLTHVAGTENVLADSLSRLPSPHNTSNIDLDIRVDFIRFSSERIKKL